MCQAVCWVLYTYELIKSYNKPTEVGIIITIIDKVIEGQRHILNPLSQSFKEMEAEFKSALPNTVPPSGQGSYLTQFWILTVYHKWDTQLVLSKEQRKESEKTASCLHTSIPPYHLPLPQLLGPCQKLGRAYSNHSPIPRDGFYLLPSIYLFGLPVTRKAQVWE